MENFHDYAYYYNMFYQDKDYNGEVRIVNGLIEKYGNPDFGKRILNIGCGTGRHDLELNKLGYQIHGIDLSDDMICLDYS